MKIHVALSFSCVYTLLLLEVSCVQRQNCGCSSDLCCSQHGFCGISKYHCGPGCREGPCNPKILNAPGGFNVLNENKTSLLFNSIMSSISEKCEGKSFYSFDSFRNASNAFPAFGSTGSPDIAKREVAAFLANVVALTEGFCYINAIVSNLEYCEETNTFYPCTEGKSYHGRGPIQLNWNFNYGPAEDYLELDLLNKPDLVSKNSTISFQTALWFWMINSNCHTHIVSGQGFIETVKELEATGCKHPEYIAFRAEYYKTYCEQLGVDPGTNLVCDTTASSPIPSSEGGTRKSKKLMPVLIGKIIGAAALVSFFFFFCSFCIRQQRRVRHKPGARQIKPVIVNFNYSYKVLEEATKNFCATNKIGEGGFGEVYKGTLSDGTEIANRKLFATHSTKAIEEFVTEVEHVNGLLHKNLVRLLGCCSKGHLRFLVHEFMPKRSLDKHLFGDGGICLNWAERFEIITGIARGLAYLHEDSHSHIVHRDVKTSNILLDKNLQPKIANFGLLSLFPEDETGLTTRERRTIEYTAPEYAVHGQLTQKADVYGYGVVVVLEIVSGKKCNDTGLPPPVEILSQWVSMYLKI